MEAPPQVLQLGEARARSHMQVFDPKHGHMDLQWKL